MTLINKAVIPSAGYGKRMGHLAESTSKEMLCIASKPMIEHAMQEIIDAGIKEICIVIRKGKEGIKDYFIRNNVKDGNAINSLTDIIDYSSISYVYQEKPIGLGDALYSAKDFIGKSPFLMVIPDQLLFSAVPASKQLVEKYNFKNPTILSSMINIPYCEVKYFQGARGFKYKEEQQEGMYRIDSILTEDEVDRNFKDMDFQIRGFGRTIFPCQIFDYLTKEFVNPDTGEIDLLKTFEAATKNLDHCGIVLQGDAYDFGTLDGYYYYNKKLSNLERERGSFSESWHTPTRLSSLAWLL